MNPNTSPNPNPEQQPTATTPYFAATPPAQPVSAPAEPVTTPPKKSRKGLFIGLAIAALVIAGAVTATALTVSSYTNEAKTAASDYNSAVKTHLTGLIEAKSLKERVDNYPKRPTLKDVSYGETLSTEYKEAQATEQKYNKLLDDSYHFVAERYATTELSPYFKDLVAALNDSPGQNSLAITDEASLASAKQYADKIQQKSTDYYALAARFKSYVFAEKYKEDQQGSAEALEGMAKLWGELGEATRTYVDLSAKTLEVEKSGDENKAKELSTEVSTAQTKISAATSKMSGAYKAYGTSLNRYNKNLVDAIIKDGYMQTAFDNSSKVYDSLEAFKKDLK